MNFDLTLAPEGNGYKIVWFSIWGSSIYITPKVREKIEKLFSNPDNPVNKTRDKALQSL